MGRHDAALVGGRAGEVARVEGKRKLVASLRAQRVRLRVGQVIGIGTIRALVLARIPRPVGGHRRLAVSTREVAEAERRVGGELARALKALAARTVDVGAAIPACAALSARLV